MSRGVKLIRSALFAPADRAEVLRKAFFKLKVDATVVDLEDAVSPANKAKGRDTAVESLTSLSSAPSSSSSTTDSPQRCPNVVVRVNCPLMTEWGKDDLRALLADRAVREQIDAVVLPKVDSAEALNEVLALLPAQASSVPLWAMIETPLGVMNCERIAAHSSIETLVLGINDLTMELRAQHVPGRHPMLYSAGRMLVAARGYGKLAVDGVHMTIGDDAGLEASCIQGRAMGFDGKSLIHPSQISITNQHFSPTDVQIEHAAAVIEAYKTALDQGKSLAVLKGKLIEALHVAEARDVLARAELIQQRD